jgi:uncharacterized protein YhbP (UPF0306 family)
LWCANAFYIYDPQKVAFYLLSEDHTRHSQMTGLQANIAGTVNGQPKTVALIRGVQFTGEIRRLEETESRPACAVQPTLSCCPRIIGADVGNSPHRAEIHR